MLQIKRSIHFLLGIALLVCISSQRAIQAAPSTPRADDNNMPLLDITIAPTATPTLEKASATILKGPVNVRSGPGKTFTLLGQLKPGARVTPIGLSLDKQWIALQCPKQICWITADPIFVELKGNITGLQLIFVPTQIPTRAPQPSSTPVFSSNNSGPVSSLCPGFGYTCSELSCRQAYACLAAGNTKLDGDNDGKPCEKQCGN